MYLRQDMGNTKQKGDNQPKILNAAYPPEIEFITHHYIYFNLVCLIDVFLNQEINLGLFTISRIIQCIFVVASKKLSPQYQHD